jgi:hypothetical protein
MLHRVLPGPWISLLLIAALHWTSAVAGGTEWFDMEVHGGLMLFDSSIEGIPGKSYIDSGSALNGINEQFLAAHGLHFGQGRPIRTVGVNSRSRSASYREIPVEVFGTVIPFRRLVGITSGATDHQLMIGAPFLKRAIIQFDYPNQRLRAMTRDSLDLTELMNVDSQGDPKTGEPIVRVSLNDEQDVWLRIDTGNAGGVALDRQVAIRNRWLERFETREIEISGAHESAVWEQFNLPKMRIGPFELENPLIAVPAAGTDAMMFEKKTITGQRLGQRRSLWLGSLGYDVLKHFVLTMDYRSGRVHLGMP